MNLCYRLCCLPALFLTVFLLPQHGSALPADDSLNDRLEAISRQMFRAGNSSFILVYALRDGLIRPNRSYEFIYRSDSTGTYVSVDDVPLPEPQQSWYGWLLKGFFSGSNGQTSFFRVTSDSLKLSEIFDPNSKLWKQRELPRYSLSSEQTDNPVIAALYADRILKPGEDFVVSYDDNKQLLVNGKKLPPDQEKKILK